MLKSNLPEVKGREGKWVEMEEDIGGINGDGKKIKKNKYIFK